MPMTPAEYEKFSLAKVSLLLVAEDLRDKIGLEGYAEVCAKIRRAASQVELDRVRMRLLAIISNSIPDFA